MVCWNDATNCVFIIPSIYWAGLFYNSFVYLFVQYGCIVESMLFLDYKIFGNPIDIVIVYSRVLLIHE